MSNAIKTTTTILVEFLKDNLQTRIKKRAFIFKPKIIYIHSNAQIHAASVILEYLGKLGFTNENFSVSLPCLLAENPIEHFEALSRCVFTKAISMKNQLWGTIFVFCEAITADEILKLTSVDNRQLEIIKVERNIPVSNFTLLLFLAPCLSRTVTNVISLNELLLVSTLVLIFHLSKSSNRLFEVAA